MRKYLQMMQSIRLNFQNISKVYTKAKKTKQKKNSIKKMGGRSTNSYFSKEDMQVDNIT